MDKLKEVFLRKALIALALLMLSSNGTSQLLSQGDDGFRNISMTDPYCDEGGYVDTVLGTDQLSTCESISPITVSGDDAVPDNVSDWVLIELRAVMSGASIDEATTETVIKRKSAFLLDSGHVLDANEYRGTDNCATFMPTDPDQCPLVEFSFEDENLVVGKDLYAVVRHFNHLDIISAQAMATTTTNAATRYIYDFTTNDAKGGVLAAKKIGPSGSEQRNAMYLGDVNGDTNINAADYLKILSDRAASMSGASDIDFNNEINESDVASDKLQENLGRASQLP